MRLALDERPGQRPCPGLGSGPNRSSDRGMAWGRLGTILASLAILASCASAPSPRPERELLSPLSPDALVYLRLSREAALELSPALLPARQLKEIAGILKKTERVEVALLAPEAGIKAESGPAASPGRPPKAAGGQAEYPSGPDQVPGTSIAGPQAGLLGPQPRLRFQAVLQGDYSRFSASLGLGFSRAWKRRGGVWRNKAAGLELMFVDREIIVVGSEGVEPMAARLADPSSVSPLSPRARELAEAGPDLLIALPEPFSSLGSLVMGQRLELPIDCFLIAGARAGSQASEGGENRVYEVYAAFLADSPEAARLYRPALGLAWYLLARSLFPGEEGLQRARFSRSEEIVSAGGMRVSTAGLAGALERLRQRASPEEGPTIESPSSASSP